MEEKNDVGLKFIEHRIARSKRTDKITLENGKVETHEIFGYEVDGQDIEVAMRWIADVFIGPTRYAIMIPLNGQHYSGWNFTLPDDAGLVFRALKGGFYEYVWDRQTIDSVFEKYCRMYPGPHVRNALEVINDYLLNTETELGFEYIEETQNNDGYHHARIGDLVTLKGPDGRLLHARLTGAVIYKDEEYCLFDIPEESRAGTAEFDPSELDSSLIFRLVMKDRQHPKEMYYFITNQELVDAVIDEYNKMVSDDE